MLSSLSTTWALESNSIGRLRRPLAIGQASGSCRLTSRVVVAAHDCREWTVWHDSGWRTVWIICIVSGVLSVLPGAESRHETAHHHRVGSDHVVADCVFLAFGAARDLVRPFGGAKLQPADAVRILEHQRMVGEGDVVKVGPDPDRRTGETGAGKLLCASGDRKSVV